MTRRRTWSNQKIASLMQMREVDRMCFGDIADVFNVTEVNCAVVYSYYRRKRRVEALRRGEPLFEPPPFRTKRKAAKKTAPAPVRKPEPPVIIAKPEPLIHRPKYIHEADMDMIARIDRQGLTSGFLGDPPPGRSALDQRLDQN